MSWYQGTSYLSKGSQSTRHQRSTRNPGSFTIRLQFYQDRQKQKGHNDSYQHRQRQSTQIQIWIQKNQGRSTLRFYCKNLRRTKSKGQRAGQQAGRQASRHKGCRQDRTRASLPPRSSKTRASTKGLDEFMWQG